MVALEKATQTASSSLCWRQNTPAPTPGSAQPLRQAAAAARASPGIGGTGKTPDGKVFRLPRTTDMVSSLFRFGDSKRKPVFDLVALAVMVAHVAALFVLPAETRKLAFFLAFCFWRLSYNLGLGALLKYQSDSRGLVKLARELDLFGREAEDFSATAGVNSLPSKVPASFAKHLPAARRFLREELARKMGADYDVDAVPVEFNAWLLFRSLVDLILVNDFTSYACFVLTFVLGTPSPEIGTIPATLRWVTGLGLMGFNLWVKLDAHRVVKDFAWYWGDFFFLVEADLSFDGVFEIYPHPMYSVGYAGYYGVSIITASYWVFFASLAAHAAQFLFLVLVENPHIRKTYSPPSAISHQSAAAAKQKTFLLKLDEKKQVVRMKLNDIGKRLVRSKLEDVKKRAIRTRA